MALVVSPFVLTKRTPLAPLDPSYHAAIVERVVALAPNYLASVRLFIILALQASIHDMNSTDGTYVRLYRPVPDGDEVPFFYSESGRAVQLTRFAGHGYSELSEEIKFELHSIGLVKVQKRVRKY